jgi:hypothetical protein
MSKKYTLNKMKQINHMLNELVEINVEGLSWVGINGKHKSFDIKQMCECNRQNK